MANTLKFGNGEWYGKEGTILAYNDENRNYKPLPFNFERSSSATTINKQGLIETVGANEPRIDYKDNTKGALLLEPSRSNLIPRSEDIDTGWSKLNVTVANNQTVSPDGTLNAALSTVNSSNSQHASYDTLSSSVTSGQPYYISCFVKKYNSKYIRLVEGYTGATLNFNLDDETYNLTNGSSDAIVEAFDNGWYRIGFKFTPTTTNSQFALYINNNSNENSYTGNGEAIYIYGAQLEQGSYATSYIPTSGSAVTRVYDTIPTYLDLTPLNIGNSYTLFLDADLNVNDNNKVFAGIRNSSNLTSFTIRNNVGGIRLYNHIDGGYPVSGITSSTNKFVIRVDGNSYKVFVQGSSLSGTLTTQRDLGSLHFYGQHTELKINNFTIDDTALSDAECQALVN